MDSDDELDEPSHYLVHVPHESQLGRTVLPSPLAKAISLATRSTCLAIRVGTLISSYGFDAAKFTTLSSLELGRGMLEGILSRAGRDMLHRTNSELSRTDAETVLERSLEHLHHAMSQIVFWTTTGFQMTGTTFSVVSEISQLLLSSLDQFFGSTDSSRAIASIITLIRREFQNPATGVEGERVGVVDLVMGLCALAYLQRKCRRFLEEETRRLGFEEIVWDVVVLNDGERVDVHENSLYGVHKGRYQSKGPDILVSMTSDQHSPNIVAALERHGGHDSSEDEDDDDLPEIRLKNQIMRDLPSDTSVSISTTTLTRKMITVDFTGPEPPVITPPPGVEVVEREVLPSSDYESDQRQSQNLIENPTYRVVYRVDKSKQRSTMLRGYEDPDHNHSVRKIEDLDDSDDSDYHHDYDLEEPPPVPPKPSPARSVPAITGSEPTPNASPRRTRTGPGFSSSTASTRASQIPTPNQSPENAPNQKRQRAPLAPLPVKPRQETTVSSHAENKLAKRKTEPPAASKASEKPTEKKGGIRQAIKRGTSSNISNLFSRDSRDGPGSNAASKAKATKPTPADRPPPRTSQPSRQSQSRTVGPTASSNSRGRNYEAPSPVPRSSSRASYISVHERRRDSIVSQTETYSFHAVDGYRPTSPAFGRRDGQGGLPNSRSEKDMNDQKPSSPMKSRRARSHVNTPSLYSIANTGSQTSLVLSTYFQKSAYTDSEAIDTLRRAGTVDGSFPAFHLLRNVTRYMRFSSASYGSNFLKFMGISKEMPILRALDETHHEIRSFAHHTELEATSILLASFVDPQGGSDTTGSTGTGVPLVHYISLDHESKAVVLACRGTLGFEDVLADMACDYDNLYWRGKSYKVHKGIHASARRLLYGGDGRVLYTLKEALEEFSDYGLILCGHSLGGGVTALLGTMLAEPSSSGTGFVTTSEPHRRLLGNSGFLETDTTHVCLPSGRPIHVYAYGPPGTMSPALRKATRGLVTSVVHGSDLVPFLSLGVLHDFQAVALAFKSDNHEAKVEVRQRIWQAFQSGLADKWYTNTSRSSVADEDKWSISALTTLRSNMMSLKLLPPGEVFIVESTRVLRRDAFLLSGEEDIGRPAQRIVLKYIRDVESRFREVRFGTSMLIDHSPAKYEEALSKLRWGVVETD
ncbi:Sn1-specific diacylglycerol lipase alpha [Colletotrichum orbiculare MAFF 240422]|uniref:sn-1-specific diacylglycerol lipase n=1 Tax=Colletotrichum orbiculare (strain 104-T / ATCC 96160 / CBS 514.97 / LARS 414 / MAFF 240422) TaxID=1213857 RepID=N4V2C2_COLOR|nr:Sn1-specific diacylglycerol lipase alpha [Colletotrichum orbiculare MAFF 240422]